MIDIEILNRLNAPTRAERLANLKALLGETKFPPAVPEYINNHIHTTYSFSPYSPTAAVYAALLGYAGRQVRVEQIGGILEVDWRASDGHVRMTGPSQTVFEGVLYL